MKTEQVLNWTLEKQAIEEQIRQHGNKRLLLSNQIKEFASRRAALQEKIDDEIKGWAK